ncbi:Alpha-1,2-mannosyltransferase MNN2 [Cytospora mali]|uniref:Alpha-1,2-mannosyltransferase MNN2 n=1 Tax=Cytospora mali TaxID=578113 RepID=A0A194W7K5_CYTMA|nr:Alpha-1,2-mannosyltransferase MNN2 [Valsa mali]
MARFLSRPVLTHAQAKPQNEAACPRAQLNSQVNADQLQGEQANWLSVGAERIVAMRAGALEYLEGRSVLEGEDALIGPGKGARGQAVVRGSRGVVLAAGNHRTVEKAVMCVREMKRLGWRGGGIEVFHFEGELADEKQRRELEGLGVTIRMVSTKKAPNQWKNFELKAESILRSSFDEVLYLDSDNFPLSDLATLFESSLFRDPSGGNAVFWPDLNRDHPDNAVHRLLGIPCHDAWELDSGQVLIAKSGNGGLNLAALYLAQYMAEEGSFWFSGGDKDTFRYAFLALGIPYTPSPRWLSLLGNLDRRGNFCGAAMLQYGLTPPAPAHADPSDPAHPEPLFVHANLLKHQSGVRPGGVFTHLRRLAPRQDDVRAGHAGGPGPPATALDSVAGGGKAVAGRGLCSDIRAFRAGADVETLEAGSAFGGALAGFEEGYFGYPGARPGVWR